MSSFIMIVAYFIVFFEAIWYFTCTEHQEIPLILSLFDCILCCVPGVNCIMALVNILLACILTDGGYIKLKNNWFNRTFLAYRGE